MDLPIRSALTTSLLISVVTSSKKHKSKCITFAESEERVETIIIWFKLGIFSFYVVGG